MWIHFESEGRCLWRPEERVTRSPGAGVIGGCVPPHTGTGIEFRSSGRAVHAFNHCAVTSAVPKSFFNINKKLFNVDRCTSMKSVSDSSEHVSVLIFPSYHPVVNGL